MAGFQKFYNSPTCSDIKLKFPRTKGIIHAHRVILAWGSGYFNRKHEAGIEGEAADWEVNEEDTDMMKATIRYMYGFEFLGEGGHRDLDSIQDFAVVGAIAEKYEIAGLPELILTADNRALSGCMSDAAKLEESLYFGRLSSRCKDEHFNYAVKIIGDNLTKLRKHAVSQEPLNEERELAVALLNLVAERQSQM